MLNNRVKKWVTFQCLHKENITQRHAGPATGRSIVSSTETVLLIFPFIQIHITS